MLPAGVKLVAGRAEELPFPDDSFDFLSMGYALRHISDLSVAFAEFHRVLKPGGRLCILEITCPDNRLQKALLKGYARHVVPMLARLASRSSDTSVLWRYYWDTIEACAAPEDGTAADPTGGPIARPSKKTIVVSRRARRRKRLRG